MENSESPLEIARRIMADQPPHTPPQKTDWLNWTPDGPRNVRHTIPPYKITIYSQDDGEWKLFEGEHTCHLHAMWRAKQLRINSNERVRVADSTGRVLMETVEMPT